MSVPINPPFSPMEALLADKIPTGKEWRYDPKWDGFHCLVFKDGKDVELQSKNRQTLSRYFPELVSPLPQIKADKFVLDGEIVMPTDGTFSLFDAAGRKGRQSCCGRYF
jgi:ATP-dependent DNA ligase